MSTSSANDSGLAEASVPEVAVVITSRNRRDDTLRAVGSCFAQVGVRIEVLVYDDASDDDTAAIVQREYPAARVWRNDQRTGYIVLRNRGFRDARAPLVISIDDDAYFTASDIARAVVDAFADASIGAVAIPYFEPFRQVPGQQAGGGERLRPGMELRSYVGCAHALRRDLALRLGCYREFFIHQGEERDLCIRAREAGWRIVYLDCAPIVHTVSPARDVDRMLFFGVRNTFLFDVLNVPFPFLPIELAKHFAGLLTYRFFSTPLRVKLRGMADALRTALRHRRERGPVSIATFRRYKSLPTHGAGSWSGPLPPAAGGDA